MNRPWPSEAQWELFTWSWWYYFMSIKLCSIFRIVLTYCCVPSAWTWLTYQQYQSCTCVRNEYVWYNIYNLISVCFSISMCSEPLYICIVTCIHASKYSPVSDVVRILCPADGCHGYVMVMRVDVFLNNKVTVITVSLCGYSGYLNVKTRARGSINVQH
jgi:hypothetical protein